MGYVQPAPAPISSSWQDHKDRNPPSSEPGTDYATAYGTAVACAEAGTVVDLSWSNGGGTGRYVAVDLDDGRRVRYLHLDAIWVGVGQRVGRGQAIAASGASGFGSNYGYGPHVHVTLFPGHAYDFGATLDFQTYVGDPTPPPDEPTQEAEMMIYRVQTSDGGGVNGVCYAVAPGSLYIPRDGAEAEQLAATNNPKGVLITLWDYQLLAEFDARGIPREMLTTPGGVNWSWSKDAAQNTADSGGHSHHHPLEAPAWAGGIILALIGLVEVARLIIGTLT